MYNNSNVPNSHTNYMVSNYEIPYIMSTKATDYRGTNPKHPEDQFRKVRFSIHPVNGNQDLPVQRSQRKSLGNRRDVVVELNIAVLSKNK